MAYPHTEYEVQMRSTGAVNIIAAKENAVNLNGASSANKPRAIWICGAVPHVIRNVGVIGLSTKALATAAVLSFRTLTAGVSTTVSSNQITSITLATKNLQGKVYYKSTLMNSVVNPGQAVAATITKGASGGILVNCVLYVEPKWETPANVSAMQAG